MHRTDLLIKLERFRPDTGEEADARRRIAVFVRSNADCFERSLAVGHVTGSAWLLDRSGGRVLLTHHRKLDLWLQLGGHADGDGDVLRVAMRETREESGIECVEPVLEEIFDVDVHRIPARPNEPEHFHYDVRFLLRVSADDTFRASDESHELRWVGPGEVDALRVDESVLRMQRKWVRLLGSGAIA